MDNLHINHNSSKKQVIEELSNLFTPYAKELINSGADFSYMNMYAENFKEELSCKTKFSEQEIFEILNESCDNCWKSQI